MPRMRCQRMTNGQALHLAAQSQTTSDPIHRNLDCACAAQDPEARYTIPRVTGFRVFFFTATYLQKGLIRQLDRVLVCFALKRTSTPSIYDPRHPRGRAGVVRELRFMYSNIALLLYWMMLDARIHWSFVGYSTFRLLQTSLSQGRGGFVEANLKQVEGLDHGP